MAIMLTESAAKEIKDIIKEQNLPAEADHAPRRRQGRRMLGFQLHARPHRRAQGRSRRGDGKPRRQDPRRHQEPISTSTAPRSTSRTRSWAAGFVFKNPNATSTCGCGSSFSA